MAYTDLISASTFVASQSGADVTVADPTGFSVGDKIIIESQHGYGEDGFDGNWSWSAYDSFPDTDYYFSPIIVKGKSFLGSITNISGSTFTLDRTVPSGAVDLPFHRDNTDAVSVAIAQKATWPEGVTYHIGSANAGLIAPALDEHFYEYDFNNCVWQNVRGCYGMCLRPTLSGGGGVVNKVWRNLIMKGNRRASGFGTQSANGAGLEALFLITGDNHVIENCQFWDGWRSVGLSYASNVTVQNCTTYSQDPMRRYIQWEYQTNFAKHCTFYKVRIDSDYALPSFEPFKSSSVTFDQCGGRNCGYSCNTSGKSLYLNCDCTWDQQDYDVDGSDGVWAFGQPVFNVNRTVENQQETPQVGTDGGCLIDNFRMEYTALPRVSANRIFTNIVVGGGTAGIDTGCVVRNPTYINPFTTSTDNANGAQKNKAGYVVAGDANTTADAQLKLYGPINGDTLSLGNKYAKNFIPGVIL